MLTFQETAGVALTVCSVFVASTYFYLHRQFSFNLNEQLVRRQQQKWRVQSSDKPCNIGEILIVDSTPKVILVVGATGNIGRFAVPSLAKRLPEAKIRCCIHVQEGPKEWQGQFKNVEFVKMDSTKLDQVEEAMRGCDRVLLIHHATKEQLQGELNCINTAAKLGVKFLCKIGCPPCTDYEESAVLFNRNQDIIQTQLRKVGAEGKLKYAIIRPNFGMANVFMIALPSIQYGYCFWPWATQKDGKFCKVSIADPRDQADVAVETLCDAQHSYHKREIFVHGPEAIDAEQLTTTIAEAVGKQLKFKAVSPVFYFCMLRPMIGFHLAMSVANVFNELSHFNNVLSEINTDELEQILGRKPYNLKSYLTATGIAEMSERLDDWKKHA
jgi:uncharacterized protein YbjT (DUF2867 family)